MFSHKTRNGAVQVPLRFGVFILAMLTLAATFMGANPAGAVTGYRITNNTNSVHAYQIPDPTSNVVRWLPRGTPVDILCQSPGIVTTVRGVSSNVWDLLNGGGYVSNLYTNTPAPTTFTPGIYQCGQSPPLPPEPVPTNVLIKVLSRAAGQVGQIFQPDGVTPWACWCSRFSAFVYGQANSGFGTAFIQYNDYQRLGWMHHDANPPGGALVFYNISGSSGHVALSLGDGTIITTPWNKDCVAIGAVYRTSLWTFGNYLGWAVPQNWLT